MRNDLSGNTAVLEMDEHAEAIEMVIPARDAAGQEVPHVHNGYGACSASGCYCQAYSGSAYTCANCGHNYATHW